MYIQNLITMNNTDIKIYGKFVNELVDNKLADAKQIYDEDYILIHPEDRESVGTGYFQNKINKDFKESITDLSESIKTRLPQYQKKISIIDITDVNIPDLLTWTETDAKNGLYTYSFSINNPYLYNNINTAIQDLERTVGIEYHPLKYNSAKLVLAYKYNSNVYLAWSVNTDVHNIFEWVVFYSGAEGSVKTGSIELQLGGDGSTINGVAKYTATKIIDSYTKAEVDSKLDNVKSSNDSYTKAQIDSKLDDVKSSYALKSDISKYALKTDIPTVPTKISQLTNDSGYITSSEDVNTTNKSLKFDSSANSNNMNLTLTVTDSDNKSISDDIKLEKANSETAGLMGAVDRNYITFLLNKVNELESRVNKLSTSGDDSQTENVDISQIPYIAIRDNLKNINGIFSGTGYAAFPTKTNPTIQSAIAYKNNSSFNSEMVATFPDLVINANELKVYKLVNNNTSHTIGDTVEFDFTMGETRFINCTGTVKEWTIRHIVDSDEYKTVLGTFTINNIKISSQPGMHPIPNTKNTNRQYYTVNGNSDYFVSQFKAGKSYTITYTSSDVSKVNFKNTHIVNQDNASASTGADEISVGNIGSTKDGIVITPTINVTSQSDTKLEFTIAIPSDVYCINEIIDIQYNGYRDVSLIYNY